MIPFGKHLPREEGIEYLIATACDRGGMLSSVVPCELSRLSACPPNPAPGAATPTALRPCAPRTPMQGMQECMVCQAIVSESYVMGPQYINLCGYHMRDMVNVPMVRPAPHAHAPRHQGGCPHA